MLFKVMGSDGDESELINRMKEKESVVISDDVGAFHNAAHAALGNGRRLPSLTCEIKKPKRSAKMLTRGQHLNTWKLVCVCSTAVERTIP